MSAILYTKSGCPSCTRAKSLLILKGTQFTEAEIGKDILREDFQATFPGVQTVPFIIIDGVKINGYERLVEYFQNKPEFLQD